ncbi:hypothetical protein ACWN8V_03315 [Vagococcus elongatus]|uniref:Uncharacterized protein n=1 Tax=Vagococcus elongatus TaxID=180344 RepID=A0A430B1R0_9ENTE|nr:hypothetical protein [Vagococcus elongatus]RSU14264.1 hypothetical protein CBF29_02885 [Vagococcus elongatus]
MSKTDKAPKKLVFADSKQDEEMNDLEVVASMELTKETLFAKEIEIEGKKCTILYNKNQSPKLIFECSANLIKRLDYGRPHSNQVLVDVFSDVLKVNGYCNPYLSHKGLFAPCGAPSKGGCSWFDVMEIVRIDTFKNTVHSESKTLCTFCDGLQVVFSKSKNDFKKKLKKNLDLYLAYNIYETRIHKFEGLISIDRSEEIYDLYLKLIGRTCMEHFRMNTEQVTAELHKTSYFTKQINESGKYSKKELNQIIKNVEKDYRI